MDDNQNGNKQGEEEVPSEEGIIGEDKDETSTCHLCAADPCWEKEDM